MTAANGFVTSARGSSFESRGRSLFEHSRIGALDAAERPDPLQAVVERALQLVCARVPDAHRAVLGPEQAHVSASAFQADSHRAHLLTQSHHGGETA